MLGWKYILAGPEKYARKNYLILNKKHTFSSARAPFMDS
jgi:hypothetical protein